MPEGPEVYIISNYLNKYSGEKLVKIHIKPESRFQDLEMSLPQVLQRVYYKSKKIVFEFEDTFIVSFLGMTGRWVVNPLKHSHLSLEFESGQMLYYDDQRRFGIINICDSIEPIFKKMGPDWITDDISLEQFENMIRNKRIGNKNICTFLLDTSKTTGIGNYIKSEVLYLARIHPDTILSKLSEDHIKDLYDSIKEVFKMSIESGGFSMKDYLRPDGTIGGYVPMVYGLEETIYGEPVEKGEHDKRATWYVEW